MKAVSVMDMPDNCFECPFCYKAEDFSLGDFKFQKMFRCKLEPEDIEDVYLSNIMNKKPDWCPLKPMPEKMQVCGKYPHPDGIVPSYKIGWNACIDKIMGGAE